MNDTGAERERRSTTIAENLASYPTIECRLGRFKSGDLLPSRFSRSEPLVRVAGIRRNVGSRKAA